MNSSDNHRIYPQIKPFIDSFNETKAHAAYRIVAFQFVSLNAVEDGKMVWWNYLHKNIQNQYQEAIKEFTGRSSGRNSVKQTLINWEYDEDSFRYFELGPEPLVNPFSQDFTLNDYFDDSGVERKSANPREKRELLKVWENILVSAFSTKGATMWVSLPHIDNNGHHIFSSIFCLFNKPISDEKKRLYVSKLLRNFIMNYLIDLYGRRFKEQIDSLITTIDIEKYKPEKYSFRGPKSERIIKQLENKYLTKEFAADIISAHNSAKNKVITGYKNNTIDSLGINLPKSYKPVHSIPISTKAHFFNLIFGRAMLLLLHLVCGFSLRKSLSLLHPTVVKRKPRKSFNLSDCQKKFGIHGLKSDKFIGLEIPGSDPDIIIKKISVAEFELLISVCEHFKKDTLIKEFKEARK